MLGIFVITLFSWGLLYFLYGRNLSALGFNQLGLRISQFSIGFLVTSALCVLTQLLESTLTSSTWTLNESITPTLALESLWWDFKSVLTEELIFRGAILYILMKRIGPRSAIGISAVAFGVYHWFSYGVFGNILPMIFVFIGTGLMGLVWAYGFTRTKSIMLPLGLHLGWNATYNTLFSKGPLGSLILTPQGGHELTGWLSLINFGFVLIAVPILVWIYIRYFVQTGDG